jgi:predicted neuraminidase
MLSPDLGKTWDATRAVMLGRDSRSLDTGYPSTVQLDDGTIVTIYYAVGTAGSPDTQAIVVRYTEQQLVEAATP